MKHLKSTVLLILALLNIAVVAEELTVKADQTDPAIRVATGPHYYMSAEKAFANGLLLITIGGTGSRAEDFLPFARVAAAQGYHVVGVDYPNNRITTACRGQADRLCFEKFRREIDLGDQVSDLVEVSRENSLVNRIEKLLAYLAKKKGGQWSQFVKDGKPVWDKVVLVGHSQGSGHAAFIAKKFRVFGVICLAGPQDGDTWGTASWISAVGKTPGVRYMALLHKDDFFKSEFQIAAVRGLIGDPNARVFHFTKTVPDNERAPILVSNLAVKDPHMSVMSDVFKSVWIHMLNNSGAAQTAMVEDHGDEAF